MAVSRERILDALARLPFIDVGELALILGEPLATVHRAPDALLKDGLAGRVSHGTSHLPSSHRYYLTKQGIADAADALGFDAPSELVRAYPVSRQWLTLLIRRVDAVASVYRLAATLPPSVCEQRLTTRFCERLNIDTGAVHGFLTAPVQQAQPHGWEVVKLDRTPMGVPLLPLRRAAALGVARRLRCPAPGR